MVKCENCLNKHSKLCTECFAVGFDVNYIADKNIESVTKDPVHHPAHYCYSKYEPKDVIRAWDLNFNLGSAVKYIARAGRKDEILQDLKKAKQFLTFEIEALEELNDEHI